MASSNNLGLDTMCHNSLSTVISPAPTNIKWVQPHTQLIRTVESALSGQGIDSGLEPGATNARFIKTILTPSGLKPVILFSDTEIQDDIAVDYIPGVPLPQSGFNWSARNNSIPSSGSPSISAPVEFSQRTLYYREPFQYYNTHALVRLICKPGLTQAQNLWVSRSFSALTTVNDRFLNEIGFNWNPSKANEIFVLMPWSYTKFIATKTTDTALLFGYINVFPISALVASPDTDTPLTISYYFCPYNMNLYNPIPASINLMKTGLVVVKPVGALTATTITLGTLQVFEPTVIGTAQMGMQVTSFVMTLKVGSSTICSINSPGTMYNFNTIFAPGNYSVTQTVNAAGNMNTNTQIYFVYLKQPPIFTAAAIRQKEIYNHVGTGEEQIFEFNYNPVSKVPGDNYGQMFSFSPREQHHEKFLTQISITSATKNNFFKFELDLNQFNTNFSNINTRELARHQFIARMPLIIFRSTKNPFSNLLLRVVQGDYSDMDSVMQLPGHEWDPTLKDEVFQPYWNFQNAVVSSMKIVFTIVVLSGQIDDSGFILIPYFNTSTLDYIHRKDYSPLESSAAVAIPIATQIANYVLESVPEQNPERPKIRTLSAMRQALGFLEVGVEQIGCDPETTLESVELSKHVRQDSTNQIEGQTMETLPQQMPSEADKVMREKDFHLVGSIVVPQNRLRAIVIPISHNAFGKEEVTSAKKYHLWKGCPRFRITLASSSRLAGVAYVSQLPASISFKDLQVLNYSLLFNKSETVFWNKSTEYQAVWMAEDPMQIVQYSDSNLVLPTSQLGNLIVSFPTPFDSSTLDDGNIKIVVECNTSNIVYSRPSYSYATWDYPGLKYSLVTNLVV
jgi:hypothetical protein